MKAKAFIVLAVFILFNSFSSLGFAEVIYLKSGKIIKGKIIEEGDYHIVVKENNIPRKYFDGEIDRIEKDDMDTSGIDIVQFEDIGMSQEKAKLVVTLMNVSGVRGSMQKSIDGVIERVPEKDKASYEDIFDIEEIIELLIPLYDQHYSVADLQGIIAFYESSSGQKALKATPEIMKESVGVLVDYVKEKVKP